MPPDEDILGLPDLKYEQTDPIHRGISLLGKLKERPCCPRCQSSHVRVKTSFMRIGV